MLEEKTRKESVVMPRMAGMLSTAKMTSVVSTMTRAMKRGVAVSFPSIRVQKSCPT